MMSLLTFVISALVMGLVVTSPAPLAEKENDADKRDSSSCYVDGNRYRHGDVFTRGRSRCIKYRCYYGIYRFLEEACEWNDKCYPLGRVTEVDCQSYRCDVRDMEGGYRLYSWTSLPQQRCKDHYGQCRYPGESFHYAINGRLWNNCRCQITGSHIRYSCSDQGTHPVHYSVHMAR